MTRATTLAAALVCGLTLTTTASAQQFNYANGCANGPRVGYQVTNYRPAVPVATNWQTELRHQQTLTPAEHDALHRGLNTIPATYQDRTRGTVGYYGTANATCPVCNGTCPNCQGNCLNCQGACPNCYGTTLPVGYGTVNQYRPIQPYGVSTVPQTVPSQPRSLTGYHLQ